MFEHVQSQGVLKLHCKWFSERIYWHRMKIAIGSLFRSLSNLRSVSIPFRFYWFSCIVPFAHSFRQHSRLLSLSLSGVVAPAQNSFAINPSKYVHYSD